MELGLPAEIVREELPLKSKAYCGNAEDVRTIGFLLKKFIVKMVDSSFVHLFFLLLGASDINCTSTGLAEWLKHKLTSY